jgi:hypothetical protein
LKKTIDNFKKMCYTETMTDVQFEAIHTQLRQIAADMRVTAKNTEPSGKARRWADRIEFAAAIGGILTIIAQFIQWVWR